MKSDRTFSVIVPTYNRSGLLSEALESVFEQTHRPIELVIVDDGSTDETDAVVRDWSASLSVDPAFKVITIRQRNRGACYARNRGIRAATGAYLQFLDSDDTLDPRKLELHAAHFAADPNLDLSIGQTLAAEDRSRSLHGHREYGLFDLERLSIIWSPVSTLGPALRRGAVEGVEHLWDETLPCCQDWEYFTRLVQLGLNFGYCLEARAYVRPYDRRRRSGIHGDVRSREYVHARAKQLQSLWRHACLPTRSRFSFSFPFMLQLVHLRQLALELDAMPEILADLECDYRSTAAWRYRVSWRALRWINEIPPVHRTDLIRRVYYRLYSILNSAST